MTTVRITVGRLCTKSGGSSHTSDRISNTVPFLVMVNAEQLDGTLLPPNLPFHLLNLLHYSQYGATNAQQLRLHINPDLRECSIWCVYLTNTCHRFR